MNIKVDNRKNRKIFHGLSEISGQGYYSVKGLRENGCKADLIVWRDNFAGYKNDFSFGYDKRKMYYFPVWVIQMIYFEIKILFVYDILHFHFGRSLLMNFDLFLLKILRKKIYFEFHGSDIRNYKIAKMENKYFDYDATINCRDFSKRTKKITKYANGIILHDAELLSYIPKKYDKVFYVPLRLDLSKFVVKKRESVGSIRIVHAPTNKIVKGSVNIINTVSDLSKIYDIELILVENKKQDEALELYYSADIIIDQICAGTYGVFAIEGMAIEKPVVTYITDKMKSTFPSELPLVNANKDTLYDVLQSLIVSKDLRDAIGKRGREYVENYHDYRFVDLLLENIYHDNVKPMSSLESFALVKKYKEGINDTGLQ